MYLVICLDTRSSTCNVVAHSVTNLRPPVLGELIPRVAKDTGIQAEFPKANRCRNAGQWSLI